MATNVTLKRVNATSGSTDDLHPTTDWGQIESKPSTFTPTSHTHAISDVTNLQTSLNAKAPLASPALTGTPTAPTAAANTNSTQIATTAYVQGEITDLIGGAPGALDTLNELAAAINDDSSFASTVTTNLAGKLNLTGGTLTGTLTARNINMQNYTLSNVGQMSFNDPGPNEGISWNGGNFKIYESPNDLSTNSSGNLQFVSGGSRRLTVQTDGTVYAPGAIQSGDSVNTPELQMTSNGARNKIRVWSGGTYGMGMTSGFTYGGLGATGGEYAMTFQMNDDDDRGFWWGDSVHTGAQGAMALTTAGQLTVADKIRVGYGQSDTTTPADFALDANGDIKISNSNPVLQLNDTGTTTGDAYIDYQAGTSLKVHAGGDAITFVAGNAERARIESDGDVQFHGNQVRGKSVNGEKTMLDYFGGVRFTWDSDTYGNNDHHSIRSTYGNTWGDDLTINSFHHLRANLDANNNNTDARFEIGHNTTGTGNELFTVSEQGYIDLHDNELRNIGNANIFDTYRRDTIDSASEDFDDYITSGTYAVNNWSQSGDVVANGPTNTAAGNAYGWGMLRVTNFQSSTGDASGYVVQEYIPHVSDTHYVRFQWNGTWTSWRAAWGSDNDGSGSGLDADLLDGQHGSYYLDYNNLTNVPSSGGSYTHPTHPGDDISIDTGALTGATVISDLDFNVTSDTEGHITDANATVSTRNLTASDIGAAASSHTHDDRYYTESEVDTLLDDKAESSHSHGNLSSTGGWTGSPQTIAGGDYLIIGDSSNSSKLTLSNTQFGTSTTEFLRRDGTWAEPEGSEYEWQYVTKVTGATTLTYSSMSPSDYEYKFVVEVQTTGEDTSNPYIRINADSTSNEYSYQYESVTQTSETGESALNAGDAATTLIYTGADLSSYSFGGTNGSTIHRAEFIYSVNPQSAYPGNYSATVRGWAHTHWVSTTGTSYDGMVQSTYVGTKDNILLTEANRIDYTHSINNGGNDSHEMRVYRRARK